MGKKYFVFNATYESGFYLKSITHWALFLKEDFTKDNFENIKVYVCFLDVSQAFVRVNHHLFLEILQK